MIALWEKINNDAGNQVCKFECTVVRLILVAKETREKE
jgi:hypothetical protein